MELSKAQLWKVHFNSSLKLSPFIFCLIFNIIRDCKSIDEGQWKKINKIKKYIETLTDNRKNKIKNVAGEQDTPKKIILKKFSLSVFSNSSSFNESKV